MCQVGFCLVLCPCPCDVFVMYQPRTPPLSPSVQMAHDSLGQVRAEKSYTTLHSAYYWPRMRAELEGAYVPGCNACQQNKSSTRWQAGLLHPLPVPDERGDSVAVDFIGPLPEDEGFDSIITMMDQAGPNIRVVPTWTDISAKDFTQLFFDHWYCDNGLPLEFISNRDKLWVSKVWKHFTKLAGI